MRSFIGIDFSDELKNKIADFQRRLRPFASSGRWKYIDNFHLTLKFLGEIDNEKASEIGVYLKEICEKSSRFTLKLAELGNFQGKGCLRVLWLSLGGDLRQLNALQAAIDKSLAGVGFEIEKRGYTPHITIGQDLIFKHEFEEIKGMFDANGFPDILVDKVILFKSEQVSNKRIYTPVDGFKLGK